MFPHKSNAFHAYETNRKSLNSKTFGYLIAIALVFGVLVFTEARARDLDLYDFVQNPDACGETDAAVTDELVVYNIYYNGWLESTSSEKQEGFDKGMERHSAIAANFATVYNTHCR